MRPGFGPAGRDVMARRALLVLALVAGWTLAAGGAAAQTCPTPCTPTPDDAATSLPSSGGVDPVLLQSSIEVSSPSDVVSADHESIFRHTTSSSWASMVAALAGGSVVLLTLTALVRRREARLLRHQPHPDQARPHYRDHAWEPAPYDGVALEHGAR